MNETEVKARLSEQVSSSKGPLHLKKKTSNLFRTVPVRGPDGAIDASYFEGVVSVDTDKKQVTVGGLMPFDALVKETLKHGFLPPVVPELKSITVGGACVGVGIESSSFRYGLVHETVREMEVLTGEGSIVRCTPEGSASDLFYAFPNTYGTLGIALKVTLPLVPARPYVRLAHRKFSESAPFFQFMAEVCREGSPYAFVDGVVFDKGLYVCTTGTFTDEVPYVSDYTYRKIYYKSLLERNEDYLTTYDYIWRWDADWFWCSRVFGMQNPFLRLLAGRWMLHSTAYTAWMRRFDRVPWLKKVLGWWRGPTESVIQDVNIPIDQAPAFLEFFQKEIGIKPVWICPTHPYSRTARFDFCPLDPNKLYINFGFWEAIPTTFEKGHYNRMIEKKVAELGGFKSLYSSSFYPEDEFWSLYDKQRYRALKEKYDPRSRFGDLYQKATGG